MNTSKKPLVIGTRGSDLAMWQANEVASKINYPCEIRVIKTSGDKFLSIAPQQHVDKGFFTKEIEALLVSGEIDIAVHSLKDLPTEEPPDLKVAAVINRGAVSDLLLINPKWYEKNKAFPVSEGCVVGTTSLRRQALTRFYSPSSSVKMLRGNVPSRVKKCVDLEYGAIIIAKTGVQRLGINPAPLIACELNPDIWIPAPAQGAVAVQVRRNDEKAMELVSALNNKSTAEAVNLERKLLANFEGGCHTAFGAFAINQKSTWRVVMGMEDQEKGWLQKEINAEYHECEKYGPSNLSEFTPPEIKGTVALCSLAEL